MALSSSLNRKQFTATASQTVFAFGDVLYFDKTHLQVYVNGVLKTLSSDYTVSPSTNTPNGTPGGTVTFLVPRAAGEQILILRTVPLIQSIDYQENEKFPANTHEKGLDWLTMVAQQHDEQHTRYIQLPITETGGSASTTYPVLSLRANKYAGWNAQGEVIALDPATAGGTSVTATGSPTARFLADRFADWKNVKDFGATGNGTGNDGPAIKAAADAGKFVWFPPGTYRITDNSLAFNNTSHKGTVLMGSGIESTILLFANGTNDCIKADGTDSGAGQFNGFRVSSMSLKESGKTGGRMVAVSNAYKVQLDNLYVECWTGFEAYNTNNFDIINVNIQSITGGGTAPSGYYGLAGQAPANCYALFWHSPADGSSRSDALRAINFTAQASYSGADGILWDGPATTLDAYQCTMLGVNYGLWVRNTGQSTSNYPQFGEFHNFNCDGIMTQSVRIEAGQGFRFIGCNLSNTSGASGQGNADTNTLWIGADVPYSYTRGLQFIGCTISNCRQDTAIVAARGVKFVGCAFYDGGKQTSNTYNGLTIASGTDDCCVVGNGLGMHGANNNYKYGIEVKDTTNRVHISGNQMYGYLTKGILWGNNDSSSSCQSNSSDTTFTSQDVIPFMNPQGPTVTGNFTATATQFTCGVVVLAGTPGAFNMTTPTAAQIVAAVYNPSPGKGIPLLMINATNGTMSMLTGTGVSVSGVTPFTQASGVSRQYIVRINDIRPGSEAITIYG